MVFFLVVILGVVTVQFPEMMMMMMLNLINHLNTQFIQNIIINTYLPGTTQFFS